MSSLPILNRDGQKVGDFDIPENIFGSKVNQDVIHQVIVMYQACLRQGNASTKTRGEVSGGGAKPWRQKGTGRARVGSSRSPLWLAGGAVFGPHPRDFRYSLPKKIRRVALRESLNAKYLANTLLFIEELKEKFEKTKEFAKVLKNIKLQGRTLALLDGCDESIQRVARNIPMFSIKRSEDVNAYDILKNKTILLTKAAFNKLIQRVKSE